MNSFLPISKSDLNKRGIKQLDFVYIIGDAYVDHPSFGHAIISRVLEHNGYSVGIIPQPKWQSCKDFKRLGRPRLGFLVMSGNIDPMVNRYTAAKRVRNTDLYSPGGKAGMRPDRATIVYCNRIREAYGDIPIIIGGIEASLRRFAHYDYWSDKVRRSILIDSGADLLVYGMGERQIIEVAELLNASVPIKEIKGVMGTMYSEGERSLLPYDGVIIPSYDEVCTDKKLYAKATKIQYDEQDYIRGKPLIQLDRDKYTVQNPPAKPLTTQELDDVYALPYMRTYHPMYEEQGGVPAIKEVEFSITSCRGCYGGCAFCALTLHQGRTVTARSHESIVKEAELLTSLKNFKGYIHDIGGPTANFRFASCKEQERRGVCKERQCLFPKPCKNLIVDHSDYIELLRKVRSIPNVKKVFVRSGIRFDYVMEDKDDTFLYELAKYHISGQLKVAPEHISDNVLKYMGKPKNEVFERFRKRFEKINKELGKEQYLVPYLMSSHPGCTLKDAVNLAEYLRDTGHSPDQVQDFYPTPGCISTCMYYTGLDPRTMEPVYVTRSYEEKQMQRALLQYRAPKNYALVYKALQKAGRTDLIGYGPKCLIKPKRTESNNSNKIKTNKTKSNKTKTDKTKTNKAKSNKAKTNKTNNRRNGGNG